VVICAYTEDRWDDLVAAVESVQHQRALPHEIVVVVDHNPSLLERVRAHIPGVVVVENTEPRGLSGARNSGVLATHGELIAFLDDDAIAKIDWLERLCVWLEDQLVLGAGGLVEPHWKGGRPAWFPDEFNWVVGCSYRGLPRKAASVRNLFGGCMCIRREVFDTIGGFRIGIGRDDKRPMGCEETELCIRATQRWPQRRFFFEPQAWAYHSVPISRGRWDYFRSRCYAEGLSKALMTRTVGAKHGLASERTYVLKTLPWGIVLALADVIIHRDPMGLARAGAIMAGLAFTVAGYLVGIISQQFAMRKDVPNQGSAIYDDAV
jgi:glucosyl-dolichyl phosphate glucuronosyltransferase